MEKVAAWGVRERIQVTKEVAMPAEVAKVKMMPLEIVMMRDARRANAKLLRMSGRLGAG